MKKVRNEWKNYKIRDRKEWKKLLIVLMHAWLSEYLVGIHGNGWEDAEEEDRD
jgi:hypothetical protein